MSLVKFWKSLRFSQSNDYDPTYLDFSHSYDEDYSNLKLFNIRYYNIREIEKILNLLIDCIIREKQFNPKDTVKEPKDVYLTDFLYDRYIGIDDYSKVVNKVILDIIEFDFIMDELNHLNPMNGIMGYNYNLAKYVSKDAFSIYDQLIKLSMEINNGQTKRIKKAKHRWHNFT